MKDFVVGFSFKMTLTPESQVVEHNILEQEQVKPIIPEGANWARDWSHWVANQEVIWHMRVKDGSPCTVTYPTYKQY